MTESDKDKIYFVCAHGEVAAWCGTCDKLHGGPRKRSDEDFTVKSLVSFYETLEAVKSLPPDIRKARTMARIEAERVTRLQKQWKEKAEQIFFTQRRESLLTLPVPEGHVQNVRDTLVRDHSSQPNSPVISNHIHISSYLSPGTTPKMKLPMSRTSDDVTSLSSSPGREQEDSDDLMEIDDEKKEKKTDYSLYCKAWRKD